ncbi:MAG: right-handed parallel beta-helix repeat-containing protein [Chloroflexota bacterium]
MTLDGLTSSGSAEGIDLAGVEGTFTLTGSNNTISATNSAAVYIEGNTTIASTVTLKSVSATDSPANSIHIFNTTGSFTVTGDGSTAASGGIIDNATSNGVDLFNTENVSLSYMNIINGDAHGIFADEMTTLDLTGMAINDNGDVINESGFRFDHLYGTNTISDSTFTGNFFAGIFTPALTAR